MVFEVLGFDLGFHSLGCEGLQGLGFRRFARLKKHDGCAVFPTLKNMSTTGARFGHPRS